MKKFLSIFIALAMVLSLFAGVGTHTAKAAATLTVSATSPFAGGVNAGPTPVNAAGTITAIAVGGTDATIDVTTAGVGDFGASPNVTVMRPVVFTVLPTSADPDWGIAGDQLITFSSTSELLTGDVVSCGGATGTITSIISTTGAYVTVTITGLVGTITALRPTSVGNVYTTDTDWSSTGTGKTITFNTTAPLAAGDKLVVAMVQHPGVAATATLTVAGTITAGNVATATWQDTASVSHTASYTVVSGDTLATVTTNLTAAINGVSGGNVTATANTTTFVITLTQNVAGAAGNGKTLSATVIDHALSSITIHTLGGFTSPANVELGKTIQLVAVDQAGTVLTPTWTFSGTSVTSVSVAGIVTASPTVMGPSVVTATVGAVTAQFVVNVIPVQVLTSLAVSPAAVNLAVAGLPQQFSAVGANATYSALDYTTQVTWSDDLTVAVISNTAPTQGLLTYSTAEAGHVYALVGGFSAMATVTIGTTGVSPTTSAATAVSTTGAILHGTTGTSAPTASFFQYGTDPTLAVSTSTADTGIHTAGTAFSYTLTGLTAGTTYYFRAANTVASTTYYGSILSFTATAVASKISGLHSPSTDTLLPTYTLGVDPFITGFISDAAATSVTFNGQTYPTNLWSPGVVVFQIPLGTTTNTEGLYTIQGMSGVVPVSGATAEVYVKYNTAITANPTPALNQVSVISGSVLSATGATNTANHYVALMNGSTFIADAQINSVGYFNMVVTFAKRGNYTLVLETTHGVTSATNVYGKAVYATWAMSGNLVATTVLDPNPLYAGNAYQESYLYVGYEDGSAVTDATIAYVSGVASTWNTWTNLGNGFYKISGITPATAGNNYYTVTSGGLTLNYTLYFKPLDGTWNPTVTLAAMDPAIGGEWTFNVNYGVNTTKYIQHDNQASLTGPLGDDTFYNLGGTDDQGSAVATLTSTVQTGGKISLQLDVLLWSATTTTSTGAVVATTALNANPVALKQVFAVNPAITGDLTTVDTTSLNVGDTKDITVTVKRPSGVERNNGVVVLQSTVAGMFTAPFGSAYTVSGDGKSVTLDARTLPYNINIVGGKYVFAGLKVNHMGYIDVLVYDGTGILSTDLAGYIYVSPTIHTLTSDTAKFVAGQVYPVVQISGGISGLTFAEYNANTAAWDITPSYVDMGNGNYTFNFSAGIPNWTASGIKLRATSVDDRYQITIPVVKPTITITSVHTDGFITNGVPEKVVFAVTDPITGAAMVPSVGKFVEQFNVWDVTGNYDLQVSQVTNSTTVLDTTTSIKAKATTGNPYVDYTVDKPNIKLSLTLNNQVVTYSNFLTVTDAQIAVTPADLVLYYGRDNTFAIKALDAHGAALEGQNVIGTNNYLQTPEVVTFGGITGADGIVSFHYTPNYMGEIYIESTDLGLTIADGTGITLQINAAPVDTTAPVITVANGIDGSTVTWDTLNLTGTVKDDVGVTQMYVGVDQVNILPDGSFQKSLKLVPGDNTITITAYDAAGNKATATVKVTYNNVTKTVIVLTVGTDVVSVDGKATSVDAAPEIVNSRTFVPIRFISETFGATVEWLPETQGITITLGDSTIGLQIGNATAVIDGNIISLPAAPYIKNSRTMVPLRVISETFGGDVVWDAALRTITISYAILP